MKPVRSLLYVPANRREWVENAPDNAADGPGYRVGWLLVGAVVVLAAVLVGRVHLIARRTAE